MYMIEKNSLTQITVPSIYFWMENMNPFSVTNVQPNPKELPDPFNCAQQVR